MGSDVQAELCDGGAVIRLERTSGMSASSPLTMLINSELVDPARNFEISVPASATGASLGMWMGVGAAQPGTFTDASTCGQISVCVTLPVPPSVNCPSGTQQACPPGCSLYGSALAPTCVPSTPTVCYDAASEPDSQCEALISGGPRGSWSVRFTSVEPYVAPDGGNAGLDMFSTHGSLTATLVEDPDSSSDGGTPPTATLSLTF